MEKSVHAWSMYKIFTLLLGRGLVVPGFFRVFFFWGGGGRLPLGQKYMLGPVMFVWCLFARIFMKVGVENHWQLNGIKIPLMRAS